MLRISVVIGWEEGGDLLVMLAGAWRELSNTCASNPPPYIGSFGDTAKIRVLAIACGDLQMAQ